MDFWFYTNGAQLPPNTILRKGEYEVVPIPDLRTLTCPWYVLQLYARCWAGPLPVGITPAALLCLLGFSDGHGLPLDIDGCLCPLDLPLNSTFVGVLRPAASFVGAGFSTVVGLPDCQIEAEASRLLCRAVPFDDFHLLSVLDLCTLLTLPMNHAAEILCSLIPDTATELFGIYCFDNHWMAFAFDKLNKIASHFDGLEGIPHVAQFIFDTVSMHWQLDGWTVRQSTLLRQDHGTHCGIIPLINLGAFLGLWLEYPRRSGAGFV